jgi:hypothetical protein
MYRLDAGCTVGVWLTPSGWLTAAAAIDGDLTLDMRYEILLTIFICVMLELQIVGCERRWM